MKKNARPPPYTPQDTHSSYSHPQNPPPYAPQNHSLSHNQPKSYPTQNYPRQNYSAQNYQTQNARYPPPNANIDLWNWFVAADEDGNGHITASELEKVLINSNWSTFNPETCRLMIGMFDADRNGTIEFNEFASLWKYIQDWKACFDSFDTDRSGTIDSKELNQAFRTFGYNLSSNFCDMCVRVFDRKDQKSMKFDDFIQCCVMLKVLSTKFMEKDIKRTGSITVYYEEFLKMALDNTIV